MVVVSMEAYGKYSPPSTTSSNLAGFTGMLLAAFGLAAPVSGEFGTPSAAINYGGALEAGGYGDGTPDQTGVKAFVTRLVFDRNYNFLDVAYQQMPSAGATTPTLMASSYKIKEPGIYTCMFPMNILP